MYEEQENEEYQEYLTAWMPLWENDLDFGWHYPDYDSIDFYDWHGFAVIFRFDPQRQDWVQVVGEEDEDYWFELSIFPECSLNKNTCHEFWMKRWVI